MKFLLFFSLLAVAFAENSRSMKLMDYCVGKDCTVMKASCFDESCDTAQRQFEGSDFGDMGPRKKRSKMIKEDVKKRQLENLGFQDSKSMKMQPKDRLKRSPLQSSHSYSAVSVPIDITSDPTFQRFTDKSFTYQGFLYGPDCFPLVTHYEPGQKLSYLGDCSKYYYINETMGSEVKRCPYGFVFSYENNSQCIRHTSNWPANCRKNTHFCYPRYSFKIYPNAQPNSAKYSIDNFLYAEDGTPLHHQAVSGRMPDIMNCQFYYDLVDGEMQNIRCPQGDVYNKHTKICSDRIPCIEYKWLVMENSK